MRIRLTPQKREFYVLFASASENAVAIARLLVELLDRFPDDGRGMLRDIKELEHEGDRLTHEVISLLNRTFVTPFDRDDMYRLASALDDICDHVDEAADNIDAYEVKDVPELAKTQADVILRAAEHLHEAVQRLEGFRDSRPHPPLWRFVGTNRASTRLFSLFAAFVPFYPFREGFFGLLVEAPYSLPISHLAPMARSNQIADLFRSGQDPLTVIRWKDIHERLEEAVDACENAADVLEAILVKNR